MISFVTATGETYNKRTSLPFTVTYDIVNKAADSICGSRLQDIRGAKFGVFRIKETRSNEEDGYNCRALWVPSSPNSFYIRQIQPNSFVVYYSPPEESEGSS